MDPLLPQTPTTRPKHVWRKSSRQILSQAFLIVRPPMNTLMTYCACHANPLQRGRIITTRHTRGLSRLHPAKSFDLSKTDVIFTVNTSKEV